MDLSDKTPLRLVQISLIFTITNLIISGLNGYTFMLAILFTLTIYASAKVYLSFEDLKNRIASDISELETFLQILAVIFIGIATFTYSYMFGLFYLFVYGVYLISPYDRDWLAGRSDIIFTGNKLEYRQKAT